MLPLLAPLGIAALKGGAGVGIGYGSSLLTGQGYSSRDAALDFGLGVASIPGAGKLLTKVPGGASFLTSPSRAAKIGRAAMLPGSKKRVATTGLLPLTIGASSSDGGDGTWGSFWGQRGRPVQGPVQIQQTTPVSVSMPSVSAVPVQFNGRQAPTFNKTLNDYLADKQLQGLVAQQIFQSNVPMLEANKQEKINRGRKVNTNKKLGESLQHHYAQALASQGAAHQADSDRAENRRQLLNQQTADAEAQVPITYLEGEASKAKAEAGSAIANESSMADALIDRMASQSQQYLEQLKNAEASQTRVNEAGINQAAADAIRANAAQIRANQAQRGPLLGTLAAEQYRNAIELYNTSVGNFNQSEDRRFNQAVKNAELKHAASTVDAELQAAGMESDSKDAKDDPVTEQRLKLYGKLNEKISMLKSKMAENDKGETVKYITTKEGKDEMAAARKERDRLKNVLGL